MRICETCQESFSTRIKINGKVIILTGARKHCLKCVPFQSGRKGRRWSRNIGKKRNCVTCGKEYVFDTKTGNTLSRCASCIVNEKTKKRKKKFLELKGNKCLICGYNKCTRALSFHHLIPSEKDFIISGYRRTWVKMEKELEKCVLVCTNCHAEIHEGLISVEELERKEKERKNLVL